jgi:hypothetical protein
MRILLIAILPAMIGVVAARHAAAGDIFPGSYAIENRAVGQLLFSAQRDTGTEKCVIRASLTGVDTRRKTIEVAVTVQEDQETSTSHRLKLKEELLVLCPVADMMSQIVPTFVHSDGSVSFEQHTYIYASKAKVRPVPSS